MAKRDAIYVPLVSEEPDARPTLRCPDYPSIQSFRTIRLLSDGAKKGSPPGEALVIYTSQKASVFNRQRGPVRGALSSADPSSITERAVASFFIVRARARTHIRALSANIDVGPIIVEFFP